LDISKYTSAVEIAWRSGCLRNPLPSSIMDANIQPDEVEEQVQNQVIHRDISCEIPDGVLEIFLNQWPAERMLR
jgi:hypothetical protein